MADKFTFQINHFSIVYNRLTYIDLKPFSPIKI